MKLMEDRKKYLKEYQQLFAALLKIPDKDVQNRVLSAINQTYYCHWCKLRMNPKNQKINISTQTDDSLSINLDQNKTIDKDNLKNQSPEDGLKKNNILLRDVEAKITAIRKRKRKYKVPLVIKRTEMDIKKPPVLHQSPSKRFKLNQLRLKRERKLTTDSFINEALTNYSSLIVTPREELTDKEVLQTMQREYESCLKYENGLLPIHKYIKGNNVFGLQRQLYVIQKKNIHFDDIRTENDQTLLQVAVQFNSSLKMFNELMNKDKNLTVIDEQSNNLLHLAVTFLDNEETFKLLMESMELECLSKHNDDGFTPLHIAVRNNQFKFVHLILQTINKKTKINGLPEPKGELKTEIDYSNYYTNLLSSLSSSSTGEKLLRLNEQKSRIMNQQDLKHGRTALYFAIDMRAELLITMLIVHMANPNICDYSGSDLQTHIAEIGICTEINKKNFLNLLNLSIFYNILKHKI